jgi:hypothetical protein
MDGSDGAEPLKIVFPHFCRKVNKSAKTQNNKKYSIPKLVLATHQNWFIS